MLHGPLSPLTALDCAGPLMPIAIVQSRTLAIGAAALVSVEVHLANGLPGCTIVGLADAEVRESRERVRAALQYCGFTFPPRRITVNLAPADLPKGSGGLDLPIALGILVASAQLPEKSIEHAVFVGELSLTGQLRDVRGAFAIACSLTQEARSGAPHGGSSPPLYMAPANAREAAQVPGTCVYAVESLPALCAHLTRPTNGRRTSQPRADCLQPVVPIVAPDDVALPDLADVIGQEAARRALEVAAAGRHHMLMTGPPGAGKSMLAARLPGILPPMSDSEALSSAALLSSTQHFDSARWRRRPFRAPHHSASAAALVGGGNPPRPGEVSLGHHGVLFLDELVEFDRRTLDMLREPLETGHITISRAGRQVCFPAACQMISAMNPCPCGWAGDPSGRCRCPEASVQRYRARLSGPLLDRIDLRIDLTALTPQELLAGRATDAPRRAEDSATVRTRVVAARRRQIARQGCVNADLQGPLLARHCQLDAASRQLLAQAMARFNWSARGHHRVLRMTRTIADLADADELRVEHVAEAIQYRRAGPAG